MIAIRAQEVEMKCTQQVLMLLMLAVATPAIGQVYKCQGANGRMEYSDTPCVGASESVRIIAPQTPQENTYEEPRRGGSPNNYDRQLRALIAGALAVGDYRKAESLAVNEYHWSMINSARAAELEAKRLQAEERRANRPRTCIARGTTTRITDKISSQTGTVWCP